MAVTTNFSFQFLNTLIVDPGGLGGQSQPDVIGLDNGGFAVSHTHSGVHTDVGFYDVNGVLTGSALVTNSGVSTDSAIAELSDGNIVVVSEDADSVNFSIRTTSGTIVSEFDIADTPSSNADVAALTGGGFVVVSQDAFTFPDFDIDINAYNNDGSFAFSVVVDGSSAQDTDPVVCGLDDGGFAVAWVRTVAGETEIWRAVYNSDGSVRLAPTIAYTTGSLNLAPSITATNGGFAIVHHENGWGPATTEVTLSTYDSTGSFLGEERVTNNSSNDIEATVTRLSNGYLVVASSLEFSATDYDVVLRLYDPSGTTLLATTTVEGSSENAGASSLGAIGEGAIAALWANFTNGTVEGETLQGVRTSDSDAAGDFIFGDDFVDIMNGNAGNDYLVGAANDDQLSGGDNNDTLDGGTGVDAQFGGNGSDTFILNTGDLGDAGEIINGGAAFDRILAGSTVNLKQTTLSSIEEIEFDGFGNVFVSLAGTQLGGGLAGGLLIDGRVGSTDQVRIDMLADTAVNLTNWVFQDWTSGGPDNDRINIFGDSAAESFVGSSVRDDINAGGGNDNINGGFGSDVLTGGANNDRFIFNTAIGPTNVDRITDFTVNFDEIRLENTIFTGLVAGNLNVNAFVINSVALDASDRIIYNSATGALSFDVDGAGGVAAVRFATLGTGLALDNLDFVVT